MYLDRLIEKAVALAFNNSFDELRQKYLWAVLGANIKTENKEEFEENAQLYALAIAAKVGAKQEKERKTVING